MGQLNLDFPFPTVSPTGEDIQNQLRAVDHLHLGHFGDSPCLSRSQVLVEYEQVGATMQGFDHDVLQFATPQEVFGVDVLQPLEHRLQHGHVIGSNQFREFLQSFLLLGSASFRCADQNGRFLSIPYHMTGAHACQLGFEGLHEFVIFQLERVEWAGGPYFIDPSLRVEREKMGDVHLSR